GLGYDAFQASVLLRQGEADKILTAGPTERGTILRKIIGADRYKDLGDRVHAATKRCKTRLEDRQTRLAGLPVVSNDDGRPAQAQPEDAETARTTAHQRRDDAIARVASAKHWADLQVKLVNLAKPLAAADERAKDAERIRRDKVRLDELTTTVPLLRQ